ncbi:rhomboid family intramembrane serine protease [Gaoshiqia sediminis]|uniref:Rhomboid family intramembrane serine protease n=1 Tax=Gaoshiqia sediminis TaxID=2986998 RepID=A0AA41Y6Z2_9BACT|nr:rhomboid family intramembrane serine protease [Gaoshiqia sediminis]MCW0482257.1 rhomboid family intramembrane serine protease [Gaoshiqia sediminis]
MRLFNYYPNKSETDARLEKKIFKHSMVFPGFFLLCFWLVLLVESTLGYNFTQFGIFPHQLKGLKGILFSPFIHSGFKHLFANSVPFFVLSLALFYFYRKLAYRIFFLIYFLSGICVWLGGREAWHIGASGLVYGLGAFLFFSGIFRNDVRLLTIAIIVVFLYGGMFWGIFPIEPTISWESHLWGAASGLFLSVFYRHQGPQRSRFEWEDEPDDEDALVANEDGGTADWHENKNEAEQEKT